MDQKGDWWHIDRSDFVRDYCIDSSLPSLESQRKDCWNRCGGACCDTHCFFRSEKTDMSAARRANGISDNSRTNLDHRDISPVGPEEQLNSDSDCIDFIMEINKNYSNGMLFEVDECCHVLPSFFQVFTFVRYRCWSECVSA